MLVHELNRGPIRDSALLRQALAEVAQGVRSVTEADFLDLIKRSGLPVPLLNARICTADGTLIAIPDAWWPEAGTRSWRAWRRELAGLAAGAG